MCEVSVSLRLCLCIVYTIAASLNGGLWGGAGVQAEVFRLEASTVERGLGGAAVDLG